MHNGAIMPTDVRCLVQTDQPFPVLRIVGDLTLASAGEVRSALLRALQEQPGGLIVDVSELSVTDPAAQAALTEVATAAADWADTRVVLCDPTGRWAGSGLTIRPSAQAALTVLGKPQHRRHLSAHLEPVVGAARRARELVTEACARWDLPGLVGPGCIVVTEMVNNVVAHVHSAMTVRLAARDGALAVAVHDASPTAPRFGGLVAPTSYGGRGLLLIDSVARRWGTVPLDDGKVVWAVVHVEDESDHAGAGAPGLAGGAGQRPAS